MTTSNRRILTTLIMLLSLPAVGQRAQAVVPTPDGCYPNFTTAEGCDALSLLTTGAGNTGLGWRSLFLNASGNFNTGVGGGALTLNNGDDNTAVGTGAMLLNIGGHDNTAVGTDALVYNDFGNSNTAVGAFALFSNSNGIENGAFGFHALYTNGMGSFNNAFGASALELQENGSFNNAVGGGALEANVFGSNNTAIGDGALATNTGDYNTALGAQAGVYNASGSNNIYIGDIGDPGNPAESNMISIGRIVASGTPYENTYIGGIYDTVVTDRIVYIGSDGHLGTLTSSRRYKEEIKPMNNVSEALFALKPVTFHYKQRIDPSHRLSFGLVAEDVAQVNADLVSRDKEGKPQTVRYEAVNAMLLNEFLKEHQAFLEQQRKVQRLEAALDAVNQRLNEQETKIEKVSEHFGLTNGTPKLVRGDQ